MATSSDKIRKKSGSKIKVDSEDSCTDPAQQDEGFPVNLTDPEDVLKKMASLNFDDEETEELLKKAYEVNRELKKQLELGRLVMNQKMTSAAAHPNDKKNSVQQRPGSNIISIDVSGDRRRLREPTRMASASHSGHSRRNVSSGLGNVLTKHDHPLRSYSYHSYTH